MRADRRQHEKRHGPRGQRSDRGYGDADQQENGQRDLRGSDGFPHPGRKSVGAKLFFDARGTVRAIRSGSITAQNPDVEDPERDQDLACDGDRHEVISG